MSLNSALLGLYSSRYLVTNYQQHISPITGMCLDSAYINHIFIENNEIFIEFPYQIDLITNIIVNNAKYELLSNNNKIDLDTINLKKIKNVKLRIYDIKNLNDVDIYFDVYLFKKKLLSSL